MWQYNKLSLEEEDRTFFFLPLSLAYKFVIMADALATTLGHKDELLQMSWLSRVHDNLLEMPYKTGITELQISYNKKK